MSSKNSSQRFSFSSWFSRNGTTVYNTVKRFPLTTILLVTLASILIYQNELSYDQANYLMPVLNRVIGTLFFGVALTLFSSMLKEQLDNKISNVILVLFYVLQIAIMYLFYKFIFINTTMAPIVTLFFSLAALLLSFIFIPYLSDKGIEIYTTKLITKAAVSVFFTLAITLGVIAVFASIKTLLINDLNTDLYFYTFIIASVIFAPLHFLSTLPRGAQHYKLRDYNGVLKVAFMYIALPLLSIYTVILYLYFGKVLITQSWPSGIVSYLVVSYTAIGIATVYLLTPYIKTNKWVSTFTSVFSKAIFPLLGMMFFAIGLRINQYGFTENRYFILVIGIWATLVMIFINFNKGRNNIVLLIGLAITLLITVYGPLNTFNISINSQNKRLNNILTTYNMIENGKVVNRNANITDKDKREITNILHYFDANHSFSDVKVLPPDYKNKDMKDLFGFENYINVPKTNNLNFYYNRGSTLLSITGYDILYDFFVSTHNDFSREFVIENDKYYIVFKDSLVKVLKNDVQIYSVDLNSHAESLYNKYKVSHKGDFTADDLTFTEDNELIAIKFIYDQVNGSIDSDSDKVSLKNSQGKVLLRIKD